MALGLIHTETGVRSRTKVAGAAVAALVSSGGSRRMSVMPKTRAAPHAATSARDGTTIRLIDVAVIFYAILSQIITS